MSKWFLIRGSRNSLLFFSELVLRWPKSNFLICFLHKIPTLVKPSISLSVATESSDTLVFIALLTLLFWSLCQFTESRVFKRLAKFSLNCDCHLLFKGTPEMLQWVLAFVFGCLRKSNMRFLQKSRSLLFTFLTFALRYTLRATKPDNITLFLHCAYVPACLRA